MRSTIRQFVVGSLAVTALMAAPTVGGRRLVADQAGGAQAPPVFRSSVDLVAVDVQVVDNDGTPIESLEPSDFDVSVGGRRRRVVSASFVRSTQVDGTPLPDASPTSASTGDVARAPDAAGRIYVLAFDLATMTVGDSRAIVRAAHAFIGRLLPADRVGVALLPMGERLAPTTDHVAARMRVNAIVGGRPNSEGFDSRFNLSLSEVIDINAEALRASSSPFVTQGRGRASSPFEELSLMGDQADTIRSVQMRECSAADIRCGDEIRAEAMAAGMFMEARAVESMNGIGAILHLLTAYDGRKNVVVFSSGIPTSDRPGGRPDVGSLPAVIGKAAAASSTTIYTLHIDSAQVRGMGAGTGRAPGSPGSRTRDAAVGAKVLEEFSAASGGALLRVPTGWGDVALDRVLRETSSRYLLGVQPEESDRDGKVRDLRVRVRQRGVTVRSRTWVVVPARGVGG